MTEKKEIILGYYGDDFTGSSDVLEVLSLMGIPAILFLDAPETKDITEFTFKRNKVKGSKYVAFGVAGIARSLPPGKMEKELDPLFKQISTIPIKYFHYKICSTLDSSPKVGNIGVALATAEKYFSSKFVPLLLGFPPLNRFVVFGHLFARIGETTYRLDRHPVMAKHPITPMDESDVRLHLKKQTDRPMALVDVLQLDKLERKAPDEILSKAPREGAAPLVLFDTLENKHLGPIGHWIQAHAKENGQLLLGSSAVEYALGTVYGSQGEFKPEARAVTPTLVVSGSCAQTTADQILHVERLGFQLLRIQVEKLYQPESRREEIFRVVSLTLDLLRKGKNTVVYSALGPEDPQVKATLANPAAREHPQQIAAVQAAITKEIISAFPLKRLVTAGGDTSGYILKALGIKALEFCNVLAPGAPLCIAHGHLPEVDGLEIAIKGGQNGTVRYMEFAQNGESQGA
ncbi:four-carbon acid sugar kinase family protein [Negadavirga shengliensis]|uniref:Four-carbon acid sugar kinase family protein n=1 Tax=Negadavirga shengliensis TaxID=1389218 RepID=A0ABV9T4V2_9BACT